MTTDSIMHNFVIKDKERAEAFANALEKAANEKAPKIKISAKQLTDPQEIKTFMSKYIKNKYTNGASY